jgi:hypothetical protein
MIVTNKLNSESKTNEVEDNWTIDKDNWTMEEDEKDYQKVIYYLEVKEYLNSIEELTVNFDKEVVPFCNEKEKEIARGLHRTLTEKLKAAKEYITPDKKKEEIEEKLNEFVKECLPQAKTLINSMQKDIERKKTISFLQNLVVCIATIPLLAGFVYAGAWAYHYKKKKENLFFTANVEEEEKSKNKLTNLLRPNSPQEKSRTK